MAHSLFGSEKRTGRCPVLIFDFGKSVAQNVGRENRSKYFYIWFS